MNSLFRAIPSTKLQRLLLLRPLHLLHSQYSTTKPRFPRPAQVQFHPKVANSVRLIGHVQTPLRLHAGPDGTFWAATILTPVSSNLKMPIIFEGELAHIAILHVEDDVCVFVAGNLRSDLGYLNACEVGNHLQVKVHTLYFVKEPYPVSGKSKDSREERTIDHTASGKDDMTSKAPFVKKDVKDLNVWKDFLAKPPDWWDVRSEKGYPKGAAFERKSDGELRMIDDSTPEWIQDLLASLVLDKKPISDSSDTTLRKNEESTLDSWRDLLDNPKQWMDYRGQKLDELVNPNHPDFKHKLFRISLWLDTAPQEVLSELEDMTFDDENRGDPWEDLVQNPNKWWDNRLVKNPKDFKHKETGEWLSMNNAPEWVLPLLPPLTSWQNKTIGDVGTPQWDLGDDLWRDLTQNPYKWWDNRLYKASPRCPDFKHKETGEGLWLNSSPEWVHPILPPLKTL